MKRHAALLALPLLAPTLLAPALLAASPVPARADSIAAANNYPTVAVVDYVLGCMRANGQTRRALEACSCSIDVVASILPYASYEKDATFKSLSLMTGERASLFKESTPAKAAKLELKRAQAEADVRCF